MRRSTRKFTFLAVLLSFVLFLQMGCFKTGTSLVPNPVSYLTLINASALSSKITVLLNDTAATVTGGIGSGQYSQKYGPERPGTYDIKLEVASSDSLLTEIPSFVFDTLNFYTMMIYTVPQTGAVRATAIQDDFSTLSSTQANYRFFNLCSTHSQVDLYLNSTLVQQGRTPADNSSNLSFDGFQTTTPAMYTITAKVAGTDSVIVSRGNVPLALGSAYTIFLSGVDGSSNNPLSINVLQASYTY